MKNEKNVILYFNGDNFLGVIPFHIAQTCFRYWHNGKPVTIPDKVREIWLCEEGVTAYR